MKALRKQTVLLWLQCSIYFLLISLLASYVILPAGERMFAGRDTARSILLILLAVAVCYVLTAYFMNTAPQHIFRGILRSSTGEMLKSLLKPAAAVAIFIAAFAAISGLLELFMYYVLAAGLPEISRKTPGEICVLVLLVLSLPVYMQVVCLYAGGERKFKSLLTGSFKIPGALYLKYLLIGIASFTCALLIRILAQMLPAPLGSFLLLFLTAAVIGSEPAWDHDISFL
ncbi:MAG: hypothetical protein LBN36_06995 [Clostridiales Family XIII bacterium]|jgi:hypothetical protein|nr:hypothetical protein [Clostridiales Family XIII bacterium]